MQHQFIRSSHDNLPDLSSEACPALLGSILPDQGVGMTSARLVLADGSIFRGLAVGAKGTAQGEAVFNTGMTGYQEVLSDPSYTGQIVTMTYPEIGNYGINRADMESTSAQAAGFVMRRCCEVPSNFRADCSLPEFLAEQGIVGIAEVDTRAITRRLRVDGAMPAVISSDEALSDDELVKMAQNLPSMAGQDLASGACTDTPHEWTEAIDQAQFGADVYLAQVGRQTYRRHRPWGEA